MSFDVARLSLVTNEGIDIESRCRSIARNAVQATREAHGRGNELFTDDEAKRERMIEKILHLDLDRYTYVGDQGLVAQIQPVDAVINRVAEILEGAPEMDAVALEKNIERSTGKSSANKYKR